MADEEKEEAEESGGGRSPILLIAIVAVVLLLVGGGATFFIMGASSDGDSSEASAEGGDPANPDEASAEGGENGAATAAPAFFSMEPFVVNINDGNKDRFLKLKVDLEVSSEAVSTELDQRLPQIKDIMIGLLSSQSFSDIRSMEGKDFLREELQTRLNAVVRRGTVQQVFFTEFVVQ